MRRGGEEGGDELLDTEQDSTRLDDNQGMQVGEHLLHKGLEGGTLVLSDGGDKLEQDVDELTELGGLLSVEARLA